MPRNNVLSWNTVKKCGIITTHAPKNIVFPWYTLHYYGIKKYLFPKWCYSHYKAHPALNLEDTDLDSVLFFPAVSFSVSPTAHPVSLISLCSASLLLYGAEHSVLWPASLCSEDPYREQREEEHDTSAFVTNTAGTCNTRVLVKMIYKVSLLLWLHTHTHTHTHTHSVLIRAADWQTAHFSANLGYTDLIGQSRCSL